LKIDGQNLSEDEKLEKYKKVYEMLLDFVHDEQSQAQEQERQPEEKSTKQSEFFTKSSIEIHFCFLSTPDHIGLVKDRYIDLLCFNKDEIVVNDDGHEDLMRISNIFNFFNLSRSEII